MIDILERFVSNLAGRIHGPLTLRFILQPVIAIVAATRDGVKDAQEDRAPYFWAIFTRPSERLALLHDGWKAMARTIAIGAVIDGVYQLIEFRWIYPLELVVIVLTLAFVPYLLWRGPVNRIVRRLTIRKARAA